QLLPAAGSPTEHEQPLPIRAHPDRFVRRPGDGEHVDTGAGRVGERGEGLRANETRRPEQNESREHCGLRICDCGFARVGPGCAASPELRLANPHSAIRNPQLLTLSANTPSATTESPSRRRATPA